MYLFPHLPFTLIPSSIGAYLNARPFFSIIYEFAFPNRRNSRAWPAAYFPCLNTAAIIIVSFDLARRRGGRKKKSITDKKHSRSEKDEKKIATSESYHISFALPMVKTHSAEAQWIQIKRAVQSCLASANGANESVAMLSRLQNYDFVMICEA